MKSSILKNTTLGMIIRNEQFNNAGGLRRTIMAHMPHYEQGIILNTGSKDRTAEILREMNSMFSNLVTFYKQIPGWVKPRNEVLKRVKTERVAFFDADEIIKKEDYIKLIKFIEENPKWGYKFDFIRVLPDGKEESQWGYNPRIFHMTHSPRFYEWGLGGELLSFKPRNKNRFSLGISEEEGYMKKWTLRSPVPIYHFTPDSLGRKEKDCFRGNMPESYPAIIPKWRETHSCRDIYD